MKGSTLIWLAVGAFLYLQLAPLLSRVTVFLDDVHYLRMTVERHEAEWRQTAVSVGDSLKTITERIRILMRDQHATGDQAGSHSRGSESEPVGR